MVIKRRLSQLASLLLVGLPLGLAGCGVSSSSPGAGSAPSAGAAPDSVQISSDLTVSPGASPAVMLTDVKLVQQLYATLLALPPMPAHIGCTNERGPHYTLIFRQGSKVLVTALARRDGCRPVTLAGEAHDRHASQTFWNQLDLAIYTATPPAHPAALAIQYTPDPARVPQTARIASAAVAQRLYDAILALKWSAWGTGCGADALAPRYQLVFQAPTQSVPALVHDACHTIELNTIGLQRDYQTRGGTYLMDEQFTQLFEQIIGGATFAPASPDHLTLTVSRPYTAEQMTTIADPALMQGLFHQAFSLPPAQPQPGCPSDADKVAGKGTWYMFSFSQWGLPILHLEAYAGSCTVVSLAYAQVVQANQAFWTLVHQAASQT